MQKHDDHRPPPPFIDPNLQKKPLHIFASHRKLMQEMNWIKRSRIRHKEELKDLRALLNTPAETILMIDREGTVLYLNELTAKRLGKLLNQALGTCIWDYFSEEVTQLRKNNAETVFRTGKPVRFEDNDNGIWYDNDMYPVFDAKHNVIKVAVFARDITEIKNSEEALRTASEQMAILLESLPIVPYSRKVDGKWGKIHVGNAIKEITGYSAQQFEQDPNFWHDRVHPEDRDRVFKDFEDQQHMDTQRFEYRFRCSDGSYKWLGNLRRIFRNPDGSFSHIVGAWHDITRDVILRKESELHRQQIIQADKLASLGEVVAGVAHELNNPNSFIGYNIPLIEETWGVFKPIIEHHLETHPDWSVGDLDGRELISDMDDMIEAIRTGSERINRVVANLKDFVRRDEGIARAPISINEVIDKAMTIVGSQIKRSLNTLSIDLAENLPLITGHFQKLEQVVTNLVLNALHALPSSDSGRLRIRTRFAHRIGSVVLEIEDNGIGMKPELIERIFEPFFTTRRNSGGTGLGLSVSYNLIQEHNAVLGVLSHPGRGSRFMVILPAEGVRNKPALRPSILYLERKHGIFTEINTSFLDMIYVPLTDMIFRKDIERIIFEHPEIDIMVVHHPEGIGGYLSMLQEISAEFPLLTVIICSKDAASVKDLCPPHWHMLTPPITPSGLQEIIKNTPRVRL